MPLLMTHVEAGPGGVASHWGLMTKEVRSLHWGRYREATAPPDLWDSSGGADLTLYCKGKKLQAHQSMLAPVSPLLAGLFSSLSCPSLRQPLTVVLDDTEPQLVHAVLSLVYRGSVGLHKARLEELQEVISMMGITFPGGCSQETMEGPLRPHDLAAGVVDPPVPGQGPLTPSPAPGQGPLTPSPAPDHGLPASGYKQPTAGTDAALGYGEPALQEHGAPPALASAPRRPGGSVGSRGSSSVKGETRPGSRNGSGGLGSRNGSGGPGGRKRPAVASPGGGGGGGVAKSARSVAVVRPRGSDQRMRAQVAASLALRDSNFVPCQLCGDTLTGGMLAQHFLQHQKDEAKVANGEMANKPPAGIFPMNLEASPSLQDQVLQDRLKNLMPDSSDEDDGPRQADLPSPSSSPPAATNPQCIFCSPPQAFKTVKARAVHIKIHHSTSHRPLVAPQRKHSCQICTKSFPQFAQLRTHYTLDHFWDQLAEDHSSKGQECSVCCKRYPTHDHLLQHLANFHCLIDPYLVRRGLRMVSHEKTIKLLSVRCEVCQETHASSSALKAHMAVKHFSRELRAEFPGAGTKEKKCPKCFKLFEGSSVATVIGHLGSQHDEVLKYAATYLDMEPEDRALLPVDDFDDNTVGQPYEKERSGGAAAAAGPFQVLVCQLCLETSASARALKTHYYQQHYRVEVAIRHPSITCSLCGVVSPSQDQAHQHLVRAHCNEVLLPLMAESGLWVGDSKVLEEGEVKCHRLDVRLWGSAACSSTGAEREEEQGGVAEGGTGAGSTEGPVSEPQPLPAQEEVEVKQEVVQEPLEDGGENIRNKIRDAFGDDSDSD